MRDVPRVPGALGLFLASCVARLPMGALGLLLVLHTQELTGSYAKGGLASGAYAIALGISNPALARALDRRGQTAARPPAAGRHSPCVWARRWQPARSSCWRCFPTAPRSARSSPPRPSRAPP